jgi:acetyl-CoA carboxylase biotin carboxyl carrier protein
MSEKHKADQDTAVDTKLVKQLAKMLSETHLTEIEVEKGDLRIRVVREVFSAPTSYSVAAPAVSIPAPTTALAAPAVSNNSSVPSSGKDGPGVVPSPMVGTAYRRPSPEAKAYVEVGSAVKAGDKILLIEAMKTFNDIVAPHSGTVTAIFVDDKQPVEFGQPLMSIE